MASTKVVGEDDIGPIFAGDDDTKTGQGAALAGTSLRDYFAGKAMQGLVGGHAVDLVKAVMTGKCSLVLANTASLSYAIADAMLAERDRGREIKDLFAVDHGLDWYSVVPTEKEAMELESTERRGTTPDKIVRVQIKVLGDS